MDWTVSLDQFEGPLDLLLHLVKRQELDIHDIPIALITAQYLDYLEEFEQLNLTVAAEFFLMAVTLLQIKARALLPRPPEPEEAEDEEDPRAALVSQLLEYERFRLLAEHLCELRESRAHRHPGPCRLLPAQPEMGPEYSLYELMVALSGILAVETEQPHEVQPEEGSIEEMRDVLLRALERQPAGIALEDLFCTIRRRSRIGSVRGSAKAPLHPCLDTGDTPRALTRALTCGIYAGHHAGRLARDRTTPQRVSGH
jgi:segregation and condensation protein A